MPAKFPGFHVGLLHFLDELAKNNNRDWFQANKARYESELLEPALAFIEAIEKPLRKVSPHVQAIAKKSGGSLMRIYRDVRFSKNKSPYKTNVGIQFRHEAGRNAHAPGFYFHIDTDQVFLGAGIWRPDSASLAKFRKAIVDEPSAWKRVRDAKAFKSKFRLAGDSLKRPPRGFDPDHRFVEDLKRKDHIAVCEFDHEILFGPEVVNETITAMRASRPYFRFICEAMRLPF